ncbi:MMPL/RND family transporter [Mycolicibacterium fallax]|uniref:MMPL/RND family transporter n=1 Tax=Mycolicibacterium fallax TaxID=1793 RepID=UPI000A15C4B6|nr:RND family transporter [Mycolicibacterium fallax]BBY97205.1 membrane protein [Mycolicibacterium fallax]
MTSRHPGRLLPALGRLVVARPVLVILAWLGTAAVLVLTIPPLAVVAQRNPPPMLPADAPVLAAGTAMQAAFGEAGSGNLAVVVLHHDRERFTDDDEAVYRDLVTRLRADTADVESVQDFITTPELREVMTSKDNQAWTLPVSLTGTMGTPAGQAAFRGAMAIVRESTADTALTADVVGPAATLEDVNAIGADDQHVIEIATVVLVLTILILVYRNAVAMLMPLLTIGVSLVIAQQVVAGLGLLGLGLGPQTLMLMTGMMMGAGVDYAVFLFSRYQELLRAGRKSDDALIAALQTIGEVIAGSAGTVALTFVGLGLATLGVFATVGPALTITIATGFLASMTLLPAQIAIAGRRGWIAPRRDLTGRLWRRTGVAVVRRPGRYLAASLVLLIGLAACTGFARFNFDDRITLPADALSNRGYDAMTAHFPISTTLQQFVVIHTPDQDLRTPRALGDLEQLAARIAQLPGIEAVRGLTRPTGETLEQGRATYQAGEVGGKLRDASSQITRNDANLSKLTDGADQLADVLGEVRDQVSGSLGTIRVLVSALTELQRKVGGGPTLAEIDRTATLVDNIQTMGGALDDSVERMSRLHTWAAPMVAVLNTAPACDADPGCAAGRADLAALADSGDNPSMQALGELVRQLKNTKSSTTLGDSVRTLGRSLATVTASARTLGLGGAAGRQHTLIEALNGAGTLAESSRKLADGVQLLVDQTRKVGGGLDQASEFLLAMKRDAATPSTAGFYIPPEVLTQKEFEKVAKLFVSADGRTVRYLVQTALNPFGTAAMDQVDQIVAAARSTLPNTALAGAQISMVGFSAVNHDIRDYYTSDLRFIVILTLVVVFLILALLLRAVVAPLYLVASVVLSYASALGIGVALFQFGLGQELHWSVPGMAFLVLVAVGADYNLLLISRIRQESGRGVRTGTIRTVAATGGVITSAGLIFAASMLSLTVSSISTVVQMGFVIGVGLLLDTFVVRTVTVPALCVLIGDANWWPAGGRTRYRTRSKVPLA